jgi:hypothetical protein
LDGGASSGMRIRQAMPSILAGIECGVGVIDEKTKY